MRLIILFLLISLPVVAQETTDASTSTEDAEVIDTRQGVLCGDITHTIRDAQAFLNQQLAKDRYYLIITDSWQDSDGKQHQQTYRLHKPVNLVQWKYIPASTERVRGDEAVCLYLVGKDLPYAGPDGGFPMQ